MKPAIGDRYRQRHVMTMRRVAVFGVDTAPKLREIAERRKLDQHEDENGDAGNGKHAGGRRSPRGPGMNQIAASANGRNSVPIYFAPAARPA